MKLIFSIVSTLLVAALLVPDFASAKTPQHNSATRHAHPHHSGARSKAVPGVRRDAHSNIKRSTRAKDDFQKSHPSPGVEAIGHSSMDTFLFEKSVRRETQADSFGWPF